jgi:DNA-binding transcriptional regulator YiaG
MPNFASTLRAEVRRVASREMRKTLRKLRRMQMQVKALRLASRGQRRSMATMQRRMQRLKARVRTAPAAAAPGRRGRRMSPESIRALRAQLGMSRKDFARVVGVSPGSIFGWENGRNVPRGRSAARLREVKQMGVRRARSLATPSARRRVGRRRRVAATRRRRKAA